MAENEKQRKRKLKEINTISSNNSNSSNSVGNRQERKEQLINERLIKKIKLKINERITKELLSQNNNNNNHNNNSNQKIFEESFILSKIAYDAARSGTEEQVNEINQVASFILNNLNQQQNIFMISKSERINHALKLAESALLMALSGIKSINVYQILTNNIIQLLSNLQYDITDDVDKIIESLELLAVAGIRANINSLESSFSPLIPIIRSIAKSLIHSTKSSAGATQNLQRCDIFQRVAIL